MPDIDINEIWTKDISVFVKGYYRFDPDVWAVVNLADDGRRSRLLKQLTNPFITAVYCTKKTPDKVLRQKIAGIYLTTHETGHRDDFSHPCTHTENPTQSRFALRVIRAFKLSA